MPRNETLYAKVGIHSWQILVIRLSEMACMSTDLTPPNFNVFYTGFILLESHNNSSPIQYQLLNQLKLLLNGEL